MYGCDCERGVERAAIAQDLHRWLGGGFFSCEFPQRRVHMFGAMLAFLLAE